jgi:hypothetical protein
MGEELSLFRAEFNGSLRIEAREERLTGDGGSVLLREVLERLGMSGWLKERLADRRDPGLITHPLSELLNTSLLLLAQGWRDQDDADTLRNDPALRLAVSERRGVGPLLEAEEERTPEGLASQPTLSRMVRGLSTAANRGVLREGLLEIASRRLKAMRGGHRPRHVTIDVDSLPVEVHGHQPGSAHNGHYHARIYHPLVATSAATGDVLDVQLREGSVHTAEGGLAFIEALLDRAEEKLCQVASVRMDAGFPEESLLAALEKRGTAYAARVRNNKVLNRMAEPFLRRPVGRRTAVPRTWLYEQEYQAGSWSQARRVVLVVLEREDDLYLHHFWIITNWTAEEMSAEALLELYRDRGTAEGHFGELMDVLDPALSSSPRPKSHYQGREPTNRFAPGDSFAHNEVLLLLNALAYNVAHTARALLVNELREGWSLRRFRERILRVPSRVLVHGRRAVFIVAQSVAPLWHALWRSLARLSYAEA